MSEPEDRPISGSSRSVVDAANPWPGLEAFWEADRDFFHGRHAEATELRRRVMRRKLTLLFSPSGLGKTSLLRAGLFPQLRAKNVLPVYIRLDFTPENPRFTAQILEEVVSQIRRAGGEAPEPLPGDTLWEYFQRKGAEFWNHRNRPCLPLLAIDQFEEIFTRGKRDATRDAACRALIEELMQLVEGRPPAHLSVQFEEAPERVRDFEFGLEGCKLLIGMREDFLPHFEELPLAPLAFDRWRLRPMDGNSAMEVASQAPELIDGAVAEGVVRFVAGPRRAEAAFAELEVDPAILSVMLRELNERRRSLGEAKITGDLLEGTKDALLAAFYERNVANLPAEMRLLIEEELLTVSGDRDNIAYDNALTLPGVTERAIEQLVENRLVRIEERAGSRRLELTHDLLTGVIVASRDDRRLREAEEQERRARVAAEEEAREARRKLRRSRILAAIFVFLTLVATTAAVLAWFGHKQAQAALARSFFLASLRSSSLEEEQKALGYIAAALKLDGGNSLIRGEVVSQLMSLGVPTPVGSLHLKYEGNLPAFRFSKDGSRALSVVDSSTVQVWDTSTNAPIGSELKTTGGNSLAAMSPDGDKVLTSATANSVQIWNVATGEPVGTAMRHQDSILLAEFSPDGQLVATSDRTGVSRIWSAATGSPIGVPMQHDGPIQELAFSPNSQIIISISEKSARAFETRTGLAVSMPIPRPDSSGRQGDVQIAFSPDGRQAAIAPWTKSSIQKIDLYSNEFDSQTFELPGEVISNWFDGKDLKSLSRSINGDYNIWDVSKQTPVWSALKDNVNAIAVSPDGRALVSVGYGSVRLWDLQRRTMVREFRHPAIMGFVQFSPDSQRFFSLAMGGIINIWPGLPEKPIGQPFSHGSMVSEMAYAANGKKVATVAIYDAIKIWDIDSGESLGDPHRFVGATPKLQFIAGDAIVAATFQGKSVTLLDANTGKLAKLQLPNSEGSMSLSPGGFLYATWAEAAVQVREILTGNPVGGPLRHAAKVSAATFSRSGNRLLTTTIGGASRLWDTFTGIPVGESLVLGQSDSGYYASLSPDGQRIIAIYYPQNYAQLWSASTGKTVGPRMQHADIIVDAVFNPDGDALATASHDGTVQLWSADSGNLLGEPFRHDSKATSAAFSPEGKRIVTTGWDRALLWEAEKGTLLREVWTPGTPIGKAEFSPDGQRLLTLSSGGDFLVRLWDLPFYSEEEAELLAEMAEAAGGYRVNSLGNIEPVPPEERSRRLAALRELASNAPENEPTVASFIKWFFTPRFERTISPLSKMTVEQYITGMLAIGTPEARREAEENFPGHPLLMVGPQSAKP